MSAAGVLAVQRLITNGETSPLYIAFTPARERDVPAELAAVLDRLEVSP